MVRRRKTEPGPKPPTDGRRHSLHGGRDSPRGRDRADPSTSATPAWRAHSRAAPRRCACLRRHASPPPGPPLFCIHTLGAWDGLDLHGHRQAGGQHGMSTAGPTTRTLFHGRASRGFTSSFSRSALYGLISGVRYSSSSLDDTTTSHTGLGHSHSTPTMKGGRQQIRTVSE